MNAVMIFTRYLRQRVSLFCLPNEKDTDFPAVYQNDFLSAKETVLQEAILSLTAKERAAILLFELGDFSHILASIKTEHTEPLGNTISFTAPEADDAARQYWKASLAGCKLLFCRTGKSGVIFPIPVLFLLTLPFTILGRTLITAGT